MSLEPETASNLVGTDHTVTATITTDDDPLVCDTGCNVAIIVSDGPNEGKFIEGKMDDEAAGHLAFTYTGDGGPGTDTIGACAAKDDFEQDGCWNFGDEEQPIFLLVEATKEWTEKVVISNLECNNNPEVVRIKNTGGTAQSLIGWELRSDANNQVLDLSVIGSLDAGEEVLIFSGSSAPATNAAKDPREFRWTTGFIFDNDDPTDFAEIVDVQDKVIDKVNCSGPTPTPTPTVAAAATGPTGLPSTGSEGTGSGVMPWLLIALGGGILALAVGGFAAPRLLRRLRS